MKEQRSDVLTILTDIDCQNDSNDDHEHDGRPIAENEVNKEPKASTSMQQYEIFLGGSCNPTTWRHTLAIPLLKNLGISYYNPQVDDWTPEMVQLESQAKSNAEILFFVIDKQTRSTVGMIESAFIAGTKRKLIIVIYPFANDVSQSAPISPPTGGSCGSAGNNHLTKSIKHPAATENRASLASTTSIVSSSSTSSISSESIPSQEDCSTFSNRSSGAVVSDTTSNSFDCNCSIKICGEYITPMEFIELKRARLLLQDLVLSQNIPIFCDTKQALIHAVQRLRAGTNPRVTLQADNDKKITDEGGLSVRVNTSLPRNPSISAKTLPTLARSHCLQDYRDIYLSLTEAGDHSWRESKALLCFQKMGLSCSYVPIEEGPSSPLLLSPLSRCNSDDCYLYYSYSESEDLPKMRKEICAIEQSRVLLFVVTDKCRGVSIMLLAAHYISLARADVVLCIQYLKEPCVIRGETLSRIAVADYNRARIYLNDHAKNSNVPVFDDVDEAVECCAKKIKKRESDS